MASQPKCESPEIGVQAVASATGFLISGFSLGISTLVIPVLLDTNTEASQLLIQWARVYHYGHIYTPAAALTASGLYAYAAQRHRSSRRESWKIYALAGLAVIGIVPFTWLAITPTNNVLFSMRDSVAQGSAGPSLGTVQRLVGKWRLFQVARSLLPLLGAALGSAGVIRELRE